MEKYSNINRRISYLIISVVAVLAAIVLMISAPAAYVYADEEGSEVKIGQTAEGITGGAYEVTSYDMKVAVGKDHTYEVEEEISVNIPETLSQIEFSIPTGSFRMRGLDVLNTAFNQRSTSTGSSVVITDPQALTTGIHIYTIRYKIYEFADRNTDRDIFYFNVLLPEWKQPIAEMSASVSFPDDFPVDELQYYAGQFGVQDAENRLTYDLNEEGCVLDISGKMIPENFGITLKAELPDGYWIGALDGVWALFTMILVTGSVVLILLIMWIIGGRDPRIKRVPQTKPIEGISPAELGYIFNNRFDGRDLVRMIIYFAISGYLKITEYEPKKYKLYRIRDPEGEARHLRTAYSMLFEDVYKGRALEMEDIGERLLRIENTIRDDIAAGFSSKETQAYTPLSKAFRGVGIVMISAAAGVCNALRYSYQYVSVNYVESVFTGVLIALLISLLCLAVDRRDSSSGETGRTAEVLIGAILTGVVIYLAVNIAGSTGNIPAAALITIMFGFAIFFAVIMRARGKGNSVLIMRLRQLRRFIAHPTPKELLENYLADPGYYYDMMIYALTFGAEESWAISFLTLDVAPPDWFSDDVEGHAFYNLKDEYTTVDYARSVRAFVRTIEQAYDDLQRHTQTLGRIIRL